MVAGVPFGLSVARAGSAATVLCEGELDASGADKLREAVNLCLEHTVASVSVDCEAVTAADPDAIGVFADLIGACHRAAVRFDLSLGPSLTTVHGRRLGETLDILAWANEGTFCRLQGRTARVRTYASRSGQADEPRLLAIATHWPDDETVCVTVRGEIDLSSSGELEAELRVLEDDRPGCIALDMKDVSFIDSTGLHALHRGKQRADHDGIRFVLVSPNPAVERALEITNLDKQFVTTTHPFRVGDPDPVT